LGAPGKKTLGSREGTPVKKVTQKKKMRLDLITREKRGKKRQPSFGGEGRERPWGKAPWSLSLEQKTQNEEIKKMQRIKKSKKGWRKWGGKKSSTTTEGTTGAMFRRGEKKNKGLKKRKSQWEACNFRTTKEPFAVGTLTLPEGGGGGEGEKKIQNPTRECVLQSKIRKKGSTSWGGDRVGSELFCHKRGRKPFRILWGGPGRLREFWEKKG